MLAFLASRSIARDNNGDRTVGRSFQTFGVRSDLATINGVIDEKLVRGCRFASLKPSAIVHHNKCDPPMSHMGVRRDKAVLSSGCKSHPANAPAGSNRSSYGGDEIAEAFG